MITPGFINIWYLLPRDPVKYDAEETQAVRQALLAHEDEIERPDIGPY
jgi:hypothetical protein